VRLFLKSGGVVDALAFEKDAADRVEGFTLIPLDDGMDVIDYGAIEVSLEEIVAASVRRHRAAGLFHIVLEVKIGFLDEFSSVSGD